MTEERFMDGPMADKRSLRDTKMILTRLLEILWNNIKSFSDENEVVQQKRESGDVLLKIIRCCRDDAF